MRVGIDYLPAVCHAPGIGRYARELVRALVRLPQQPELALFEVGGGERIMRDQLGLEGARVQHRRSRAPRRLVQALHRITGRGADHWLGGVDIFHRCLPDYPPVARAREVLPVAELPAPGSPADERLARALERCAASVVFCAHYAELLPARYGLAPERVHRVRVGCEHWTRPGSAPPCGPEPDLPARILVLGAIRRERDPLRVLRAFELLRADGEQAELVFAGNRGSAAQDLEAALAHSPARAHVTWRRPIEAEMPDLVAGAALLVHVAQEEGTPVTPLEAFAAGVPVVASHLPAFAEALGDEARLVQGPDSEGHSLAQAMRLSLAERALPGAAQDAAERRRAIAREHTWEANARATVAIWSQVLEEPG